MNESARKDGLFPGWRHLGQAAVLLLGELVVFWSVYCVTDYITRWRTLRPINFAWELTIPFVPAMMLAYVSLYGLFLAAPFVLRTERELRALAAALIATILVAAVGFLIWPAESAFPPPTDLGIWAGLYQFADRLNLRYNMAPSLHVALGIATAAILAQRRGLATATLLWSWALLISLSTLLTHQHHVLDVVTGAALGMAADRIVFRRLVSSAPSATSGSKTLGSNTVGLTAPNACPRAAHRPAKTLSPDPTSCRTSSGPS
jgi:membrane-associated phospholipid phosphatase